jgi:Protein of unknown function (DUF4236)
MGFRYRKSLKLLPGLPVSLSKSGASSLSVGQPGATVNINSKGVRTTIGVPGSGLSYQTRLAPRKQSGEAEIKLDMEDLKREKPADGVAQWGEHERLREEWIAKRNEAKTVLHAIATDLGTQADPLKIAAIFRRGGLEQSAEDVEEIACQIADIDRILAETAETLESADLQWSKMTSEPREPPSSNKRGVNRRVFVVVALLLVAALAAIMAL